VLHRLRHHDRLDSATEGALFIRLRRRGPESWGTSDLSIAISTLAVAALFGPLRALLQTFIDSRFYRSKYDATQTVEAFSARLRDEVDIDTLTKDLLAVVQDSMQPRSVSLWLRGSSDSAATSAHG
jgi:hypothetical protein